MYSWIFAAHDGLAGAARAVAAAIALAKLHRAERHMITVEELPRFPAEGVSRHWAFVTANACTGHI